MKTAKTRDVKGSLLRKGFKEDNNDHKFYHLYVNDKRTSVRTKISHGETEIDSYILNQMAKQVCLTNEQFEDLINCPLSYNDYVAILIENHKITL
ncbi:MAG: hypothetical protein ACM3TR_06570 [Caulobacteraceae bacterium]